MKVAYMKAVKFCHLTEFFYWFLTVFQFRCLGFPVILSYGLQMIDLTPILFYTLISLFYLIVGYYFWNNETIIVVIIDILAL